MAAESATSNCKTISVICFNTLVSALGPAAQATMMPVLTFFKLSKPLRQLSVGDPSVIKKTKGFQSPFCSAEVLTTSASIRLDSKVSASPKLVDPVATIAGI